MNGNGTHDAPATPPRAMQGYQEMGRPHPKTRGQTEYRRPKTAIQRKTPKRGPHPTSDKDIEHIKEKIAMRDALGEYKWILSANLGLSQSDIAEERKKDRKKFDRLRRIVSEHGRNRSPGRAYPGKEYKTTPRSGQLRGKRFGRPRETRKGRIEGTQWEGILRTLRREIPINYQRIRAQDRRKQTTKVSIQGHLERKKAHWKNKVLRRTVVKKLLTHRITKRKTTATPPIVVISSLIYLWGSVGSVESNHLTLRPPWGHARYGGKKKHGRNWQNVMGPWRAHGCDNLTVKAPWMVPPWWSMKMREPGSNNLTERVPWLVPPWGHHAIEKHGKDDLTETAPWMVPPWR